MWITPIALTPSFALGVHLMMDTTIGVPAPAASESRLDLLSSSLEKMSWHLLLSDT